MSIPSLGDMIVSVELSFPAESTEMKLSTDQVKQLERIKQASEETANVLTSGIEAVGELMGLVECGDISPECVLGIGWLLKELAGLTRRLHEERCAAEYKLHAMSSAPRNRTSQDRGTHGDAQ